MRLLASAVLLAATLASAESNPPGAVSGIVTPGSVLTLPLEPASGAASFLLHAIHREGKTYPPVGGEVSGQPPRIRITLPANLEPGPYYLTLADGAQTIVPGSIDVEPDLVKLDSVHPATAYQGDGSKFDFDLVGEDFSLNPANDDVLVEGRGSIVRARAEEGQNASGCAAKENCLWVESPQLMHIVGYRAETHHGLITLSVRVGTTATKERKPLVLARMSGAAVFLISLVATGLLFGLVYLSVSGGLKGNKLGAQRISPLRSFIYDSETNSYSLSKFQLLVFSATFIFGYVYVLLARWLVQWQFTLPDVPSAVAGLLGISGGTAVAAAGLSATRGSKGAGLQRPTGADLISTGGVVVPERFQFFVWTLIACSGFLALLVSQDPALVNGFPEIPQGLLYVMGVSAAGYLGGKTARKPGPVIESIAVDLQGDHNLPVVTVQGQNLSSDARLQVDGLDLPIVSDSQKHAMNAPKDLISPTPQSGAADSSFASMLKITIATNTIDLGKGDHRFRIVNRDGQFADMVFTAHLPVITAVVEDSTAPVDIANRRILGASQAAVTVIIKGTLLPPGTQTTWRPPGSMEAVTAPPAGQAGDGTTLRVKLVPGAVGSGMITVTTPAGFSANASVDVVSSLPAREQPAAKPHSAAEVQSVGQPAASSGPTGSDPDK